MVSMIVVGMPDGQLALQIVVSVLLPALVGLVTTKLTPGWGKSSLLVVLTLLSTVAVELSKALQTGMPFNVAQVAMIAAGSYVLSMAVHLGIMNPSGLKEKLASVGIRADPKLEALAVVGAEVMTDQGPVPKAQLAAELDYAEGAPVPVRPRDAGYDAVPVRTDLIAPLQERGLIQPVSAPKHRGGV